MKCVSPITSVFFRCLVWLHVWPVLYSESWQRKININYLCYKLYSSVNVWAPSPLRSFFLPAKSWYSARTYSESWGCGQTATENRTEAFVECIKYCKRRGKTVVSSNGMLARQVKIYIKKDKYLGVKLQWFTGSFVSVGSPALKSLSEWSHDTRRWGKEALILFLLQWAAQPTRRWEKKCTLVVCSPLASAICPLGSWHLYYPVRTGLPCHQGQWGSSL